MKLRLFLYKPLFKASFYNFIIVVIKAFSGIIFLKVFALFLGPSGFALIGNFRNFIQIAFGFTAEGYQNGIVRYVSETHEDKLEMGKVIATVFQLSLSFSVLIGIITWGFSGFWSEMLFQNYGYSNFIKLFGVGLPFMSFNLLIIYVLNGLEQYKKITIITSILFLINMGVNVLFTVKWQLNGALVSLTVGPVLAFLFILLALGKDRRILFNVFNYKFFSVFVLKKMNLYFLMAGYSAIIVSITYLSIRNLIIRNLGSIEAGYWEAMNRISTFYLMFFLSLTSFYLLPKLSKIHELKSFKKELKYFYSFNIPILLISFLVIYFLRFFILRVLLSDDFTQTSTLFYWQLIGDFISVIAIALVKQFHAKLMIKAYFICNGLLNVMYFTFSYFFVVKYGLVGVTKAYALSYGIYLIVVFVFVFNYFKKPKKEIK